VKQVEGAVGQDNAFVAGSHEKAPKKTGVHHTGLSGQVQRSKDRTLCGAWLAWANIAVAA
jgi:D-aminopeptidase